MLLNWSQFEAQATAASVRHLKTWFQRLHLVLLGGFLHFELQQTDCKANIQVSYYHYVTLMRKKSCQTSTKKPGVVSMSGLRNQKHAGTGFQSKARNRKFPTSEWEQVNGKHQRKETFTIVFV